MQLTDLIKAANIAFASDTMLDITGISIDSRSVKPGHLFIAYSGNQADGRDYIEDAIAQGAIAILTTADITVDGAEYIAHPNPHECVAPIAAAFYPNRPEHLLAVTGTNGKTSVAQFSRQLLAHLGYKAASMGTTGVEVQDGDSTTRLGDNAHLTSPDPITLHQTLSELAEQGVTHVCLEASSHGLDQGRLDALDIQVAAFTNLSRDHLDYHGSMEVYFEAKKRLFHSILKQSHATKPTAVLPTGTPYLGALRDGLGCYILTYGHGGNIQLDNISTLPSGLRFTLTYQHESFTLDTPLLGAFQAHNIACAVSLLVGCGCEFIDVVNAVESLHPVPGRMERVEGSNVVIDYAHTPDALEQALESLRAHVPDGGVQLVFGCGGDRDTGKRAEMGEIANRLADRTIITDDNPRHEDPAAIRAMILAACANAEEIGDRKQAIETAIAALQEGDILLIAGKGHEDYQLVGDEHLPFSDRDVAQTALK